MFNIHVYFLMYIKLWEPMATIQWSYDLQRVGTGSHTVTTPHPTTWDKNELDFSCSAKSCYFFSKNRIIHKTMRHHTIQHFHLTTTTLPPKKKEIQHPRFPPFDSFLEVIPSLTISPEVVRHMANIPTHSPPVPRSASDPATRIVASPKMRFGWTGEIHWFDEAQCVFSGLKKQVKNLGAIFCLDTIKSVIFNMYLYIYTFYIMFCNVL